LCNCFEDGDNKNIEKKHVIMMLTGLTSLDVESVSKNYAVP